jgi:glycerate 2-kinase
MTLPAEPPSVPKPLFSTGKHLAWNIFLETLAAIDVRHTMLAKLRREGGALVAGGVSMPLLRAPRVVALGKAASRMAAILDEILSGQIEAGVCVAPQEPAHKLAAFRYFSGGHPYPGAGSLAGAEAILQFLSGLTSDDFVIFLISGGGSALVEKAFDPGVSLSDLAEFNRLLVTSGLPIQEINVLRKHVSAVKGGRLAVAAHPARQLTIFISDVPEHLPSMVASGPTMPDESTAEEAYALAAERQLLARLPAALRKHFEERTLAETPKPDDERFQNSHYFCLLSNRDAVEAARAAAEKLGLVCEIDSGVWDDDFRRVAQSNLAALDALARAHAGRPVCLAVGGEVTCPVTGPGTGGRNQAFALYAAGLIAGSRRVVLSAGTDGRDGNSPSCGAVADGQTLSRARILGLDPQRHLAESDSYHFFRSLGDTFETGFTDNNVRDVRLWMEFPEVESSKSKVEI